MTAVLLTALFLNAPAPAASHSDWPQWRGPNRDGKSTETGLVIPKDGPPLAWKNDNIGVGYGQPIVLGKKIYVLGSKENKPDGGEYLQCLNLDDGKEIWKSDLGTSAGRYDGPGYGCGPRSAPTFSDGHLYCLGGNGDLVCFTEAGKKVWAKNCGKDFGGQTPNWGYSESPLVDGDRVIIAPGGATTMVCLDAKTGKTIWQCKEISEGCGYDSSMTMMVGDRKLYVRQIMGKAMRDEYPEGAIGVDAKTGKVAFKVGGIPRKVAVIPTPIISGEYIFFTSGYGAGCECFKLTAAGSEVKTETVFTNNKSLENHHGGVIEFDNHIIGHGARGWTCMTFKSDTPKVAWKETDFPKGSIAYADGHFFCYAETTGDLAILKASTTKWDQVAKLKLPATSKTRPNSGRVWPHPVISNGKLLLRDFELLYAFDVKK